MLLLSRRLTTLDPALVGATGRAPHARRGPAAVLFVAAAASATATATAIELFTVLLFDFLLVFLDSLPLLHACKSARNSALHVDWVDYCGFEV